MAINVIKNAPPPPGTLGKVELYALSIGQVIGAGVITLIVPAIKMTGYSAWLAYAGAIVFGLFVIAPMIFVTSTLRLGGGYYSLLSDIAGPKFGGIFAFMYITQCMSLSLFGVAASEYLGDIIPALGGPIPKILVGASLLTFFYVVNLMGIDVMAGAQKLMTWLLIAALLLFTIFGIVRMKLPIFDVGDSNFFSQGFIKFSGGKLTGGFASAVLLFVYSCQGYVMTSAYGREAKNAKRDIPFALIASVPTLIILYVGVAIAATGALSVSEYGNSTSLVFAARAFLHPILFYVFIIGGPIMALLSTLNSSFAYNSITIRQSCVDGWLPEKFGAKNNRGAHKWILTFMYILGLIPIVLRFNINTIVNQIQLIGATLQFMYMIAYFKMPAKYPEAWKKSRLHIPTGLYYLIVAISLSLNVIVLWKSCLSINTTILIVSLSVLAVCIAIGVWRGRTGNITIRTSVWPDDAELSAAGTAK